MAESTAEMIEAQKKNCIFCKIIAKEIPAMEIYSDSKVLVILDINPANEGHALILPKNHYQILPQIPEDLIGHLFKVAKKTSHVLIKGLGVKGTTIFVANGAIAGQKAPHFMIHVIPRKHGDMLFKLAKNHVDDGKLKKMQEMLSLRLSGKPVQKAIPAPAPSEEDEEPPKTEKKGVNLDKIAELFG
ncbi:MAG: HIT domain-containing protein [Nanoarchaeota archaeon]|nr:HIT domain-containing protein [Nanoarchaeota archaeon]